MPWFLGFEFKDSGLCVVCYFCVCVLAWPSLAPCEGRFEALCELFFEHQLWHNLLGESGWP